LFGVQSVNSGNSNIILLIDLGLVSLLPIVVAFGDFIPESLYPLAVGVVALSLVYHNSLISMYVVGVDVHQEYYFAELVRRGAEWNQTIPNAYNSVLSVVMLAPMLSIVSGINITWVFKAVYPLLFSLVPVVLYEAYKRLFGSKIAFFASFFFVSVAPFFSEMIAIGRQEIAEVFLSILVLLIVRRRINRPAGAALVLLFSMSMVVSHYGTSYIIMFSLVAALAVRFLADRLRWPGISSVKPRREIMTTLLVMLYYTFCLAWYLYVSSSWTLDALAKIIQVISSNIFTEFLNPEAAQGAWLLTHTALSPLHELYRIFQIVMQFFIAIGLIVVFAKRTRLNREYLSLSLVAFLWMLAAIVVPYLAQQLNTTRLYHLMLIFLAPFCVMGAIHVLKGCLRIGRSAQNRNHVSTRTMLRMFSILLCVFLLFNSEFVFEVVSDNPYSFSISQSSIMQRGHIEAKSWLYSMVDPPEDVASAMWLSAYADRVSNQYSDYRARNNVLNAYGMLSRDDGRSFKHLGGIVILAMQNSYVYLRQLNVVDGLVGGEESLTGIPDIYAGAPVLSSLDQHTNKLYSNGGSQIFYANSGVQATVG
jgi:uncharacterized membrane protein